MSRIIWAQQLEGADLVVLATGSGKSHIIAEVANRLKKEVLILQPSSEILTQNYEKLRQYVPKHEIGIFSASMSSKQIRKYTFATIGSIFRKPELFKHIGLILLDEAHTYDLKSASGMYSKFFKAIGSPKVVGLTATPYRNVLGYHRQKDGSLDASVTLKLINRMKPFFWKRILCNVNICDLVEQGYLCPLKYEFETFLTHEQMKTNVSRSDFDQDDFAVKLGNRQQQVVEKVQECEKKYKSVLVFCSSVAQAKKFSEVTPGAAYVHAKTEKNERDRIIRQFKNGQIKTVYNVSVLSIGFDHPELDCIILLRPTRSVGLYLQLLGRGVRLAPGKSACTVIDFTNTVEKIGPVESVRLVRGDSSWELYAGGMEDRHRWHNRQLYAFRIKPKSKSQYIHRAIAARRY